MRSRIESLRFQDDPWRRLTWQTPLSVLVTFLALMGFVQVLEPPPSPFKSLRPLDVQVVEPPSAVRAPTAPAVAPTRRPPAPKPPTVKPKPEPVPPPPPELAAEKPEPPPPVAPEPAPAATAQVPESAPTATASTSSAQVNLPVGPAAPTGEPARRDAAPPAVAVVPPPGSGTTGSGLGGGRMGARAIYQPVPEIPEELRRRAIDFVAIARFRVAANGSAQVELTQPTADPDLNRALMATLKRWRFFPATQDGKPIPSAVDIRIPISVR